MTIDVKSKSFDAGQQLPPRFSCDGEGISPHLGWSGGASEAKSFVVFCEDTDAPGGSFGHWGVFNIPARQTTLEEGVEPEANGVTFLEARNDFGDIGYGPVCPPPGDDPHNYHFHVWALEVDHLEFDETPDVSALKEKAKPHMIDHGEVKGWFQR